MGARSAAEHAVRVTRQAALLNLEQLDTLLGEISPKLPTLPGGWQERMIPMTPPSGVRVKFLEPNDAAVSKYARGEPKDREWIREGLRQSIMSLAAIEHRFRDTPFLDHEEHERAKACLEEDRHWLESIIKARRR